MAEYMDKNPYPYGDKETELEWNIEDRTEEGIPRDDKDDNEKLNEAINKEFDNKWVADRPYPGKFLEHKWAHVSIWDRTGSLTLKAGYFYRIFRCRIIELKAEQKAWATFIDCNIDLLTKLDEECCEPKDRAQMTFIHCRLPFVDNCKNYFMTFEGETYLDEFKRIKCCEMHFKMTKKWICSTGINNLYKIDECKIIVKSNRWISGNDHTANFKGVNGCIISIFGTDMIAR